MKVSIANLNCIFANIIIKTNRLTVPKNYQNRKVTQKPLKVVKFFEKGDFVVNLS